MRIAFVSNYINHHQIPFCNAMNELLKGEFTFVQTEPMEEERVRMGWHAAERPEYVRCFYEEEEFCRRLILDCDVLLFGGTDEESYIWERLKAGKLIIRMSERLYKTGQWKAVSPRGLRKKYLDHTRYRKAPVYLLCAGAYVPSDFHIVRAYPGKMYCWGYFPETRKYEIESLLEKKGYGEEKMPYVLWAARMIDWKHPELSVETARHLKERGIRFHMDIIGDGQMRPQMEELAKQYKLGDSVAFCGYQPPEKVRQYMEKADIFLFTSDRKEGWGAVANEAMNSGCAVVANHMIGAVPFLLQNGVNGLIYEDGKKEQLFSLAERLAKDRLLNRKLGRNAYETITEVWNGENAAKRLMELIGKLSGAHIGTCAEKWDEGVRQRNGRPAPCAPAQILSEYGGRKLADSGREM
ncbi:MAG: glycosyltransferase family 4 protein [Lachnospiraceae bacterium]|nr:glycosyltransferase family 4 protein [Lachnospiraceae bacterium]